MENQRGKRQRISHKEPYSIGLDIGTASVGSAVINNDLTVPRKRFKVRDINGNVIKTIKKNMSSVLIFDEANPAKGARTKRTSRRRYTRRNFRLLELKKLFEKEIEKIDPNFFHRIKEDSFFNWNDKEFDKHPLFGNLKEEKKFHNNYPTVFHLRNEIGKNSSKKFDLRLVYLALAHIIKYRGHFLDETFDPDASVSVEKRLNDFIVEYNELFDKDLSIEAKFSEILMSDSSNSVKIESILSLYPSEKNTIFQVFLKLIVGNQGDFNKFFKDELESSSHSGKLVFSSDEVEDEKEELISTIGEDYLDIINLCQSLYSTVALAKIINTDTGESNTPLSASMVKRYNEHKGDLANLKGIVKRFIPEKYEEVFGEQSKTGYTAYIRNPNKMPEKKFYDYLYHEGEKGKISGLLSDSRIYELPAVQKFILKIEQKSFLKKQRTKENGLIPYQLHLKELKIIIENQSEYYPFLHEIEEKLEKLLTFRIPYFVGPLAQTKYINPRFNWLVRKSEDHIKPWNFSEIVDEEKSATKFIEKLISNDQFLFGEKVLPKRSIIYQQFLIFNELTKVSYQIKDGPSRNFDSETKEKIFNSLFKKNKLGRVTVVDLKNYIKNDQCLSEKEDIQIEGIKKKFNSSYSTYADLSEISGLKELLDDDTRLDLVEEIIRILTVFEDKKMRTKQLSKLNLPSNVDIEKLCKKHYKGWANVSKKLIDGIIDGPRKSGKTILGYLKDDDILTKNKNNLNRNFAQLITDKSLDFARKLDESYKIDVKKDYPSLVEDIPGSPTIRRAILQSLYTVDEIIGVMGGMPENIVIEMARTNEVSDSPKTRKERIKKLIKETENDADALNFGISKVSEIFDEVKKDENLFKELEVYLYFLQKGKDMYVTETREAHRQPKEINFYDVKNSTGKYQIDHIIPQSLYSGNPLDNIVLTESTNNKIKDKDVPDKATVDEMKNFWLYLMKKGAISKKKFSFLTKIEQGGLSNEDKFGFINRQLVETRQITKHVARLLNALYEKDDVRIVTLKANMVTKFRKRNGLYKFRELNDLHHAHDAYLVAVIATKLLNVYPKIENELVYGKYRKESFIEKLSSDKAKQRVQFYDAIMKFFDKEEKRSQDNKEILWRKQSDLKVIRDFLDKGQVNVVRKTEKSTQGIDKKAKRNYGLFKETITKNNKHAKESGEKFVASIPIKEKLHGKKLDVEKYGGYQGLVTSFTILIFETGKKGKSKIENIPIFDRNKFEENPKAYLKEKYPNFEDYVELPKYSLLEFKKGYRRYLVSASELHPACQFRLPKRYWKFMYKMDKMIEKGVSDDSNIREELGEVNVEKMYEGLLEYCISFMKRNCLDKTFKDKKISYSETLQKNYYDKAFSDARFSSICAVHIEFRKLLSALTTKGGSTTDFFSEKGDKPLGFRYQGTGELKPDSKTGEANATLIRQSITGLYETRIDLGKLGED